MSPDLGNTISIDLGTTYSTGCYLDESGKLSVIEDPNGIRYIPSVVTFGNTTVVGEVAAANKRVGKPNTFYESKRLLAKAFKDKEVTRLAKYWPFTIVEGENKRAGYEAVIKGTRKILYPEEVAAQIIKYFCDLVETNTGRKITNVVITVPAFFDSNQRAATKEAASIVERKCLYVIDEPTAAAVDFSVENDLRNKTLVVYDLGGGTFDVSVMSIKEKEYKPIRINGDSNLGGANFNNLLSDIIMEQIRMELEEPNRSFTPKEKARIQEASEEAKIALSTTDSYEVPVELDDNEIVVYVTRDQFEKKIRPLIQKTVEITKECVEEAGLSLDQLDYVAMIGGSTNIPLIKDMLNEAFPLASVKHTGDVRSAVARGAFMWITKSVDCRVGPGDQIISEKTGGMIVPERQSGMVVPERQSGMVIPERQSGMVVPERQSGMVVPEKRNDEIEPEGPRPTGGMVVPEKGEDGVEPSKSERTSGMVVPEKGEDGIEPSKSEHGGEKSDPPETDEVNQNNSVFVVGTDEGEEKQPSLIDTLAINQIPSGTDYGRPIEIINGSGARKENPYELPPPIMEPPPMFPINPVVKGPIGVLGLDVGIKVLGGIMDVIIPRGRELPSSAEKVYSCERMDSPVDIILYQGNRPRTEDNQRIGAVAINMRDDTTIKKGRFYLRVCVDYQNMVAVYVKYHKKEEWTELKELNQSLLFNDEQIDRMRDDARKLEDSDKRFMEWMDLKHKFEELLSMYKTHEDRDVYDPARYDQWEAWMRDHAKPPRNGLITEEMKSEWRSAIEDVESALKMFF